MSKFATGSGPFRAVEMLRVIVALGLAFGLLVLCGGRTGGRSSRFGAP